MQNKKLLIFSPLLIYLIDFGYGLLRVDGGDMPGRASYGWLYMIYGIILVILGYVATTSFNYTGVKEYFGILPQKSPLKTIYLASFAGLVLNFVSIFVGNFYFLMALAACITVRGQIFLIIVLINWLATFLILRSGNEIPEKRMPEERANKIIMRSLGLFVIPVITFFIRLFVH